MKKFLSGAVALSMTVVLGINSVYAAGFSDLGGYEWASPYIYDLAGKGIVKGAGDGTYMPGMPVSRLQIITMISNLAPKEEIDSTYAKYISKYDQRLKNAAIEEWAKPYVVYALVNGIIPDKDKMLMIFIDQDKYKKEGRKVQLNTYKYEVCVFLVRALGMEKDMNSNAKLTYKDTAQIEPQAIPYIEVLQRKGILSKTGDGSGMFRPNKILTRAEAAVMLSSAYKYSKKAKMESSLNIGEKETTDKREEDNKRKTIKGKVNLLSFADNNITIAVSDEEGRIRSFTNKKNNILVKLGDKITSVNSIKIGQEATFDVQGDVLNQVILQPDVTEYSGTVTGYSTEAKTISVDVKKGENKGKQKFKYNEDTRIYVNDKLTDIENLPKDNDMEFTVEDGVIVKGSMTITREKIDGEIADYTNEKITINSERKGMVTKNLAKELKIYRNEKRVDDIFDLAIGDKAVIDVDNDLVKQIDVTAKRNKYLSAVIKEIQMNSKFNKIVIEDRDGKTKTLTVDADTLIRIDSKKSDIYNLKVGYKVDVYSEGGLVDEINSKGEYKPVTISGIVTSTKDIDKMIEVKEDNKNISKVYYDLSTKAEKLKNGLQIDPKDIQKDDEVTIIGYEDAGIIRAIKIIANY